MTRKLFVIVLLLSAANVFAQAPAQQPPPPPPMQERPSAGDYSVIGSPLPDFTFKANDGKLYSRDDFKNNANLFIMLFDPGCSHCQQQTKELEENIEFFKKSKIVLITNSGFGVRLPDFIKDYNTDKYPFTIGIDSTGIIKQICLYQRFPQINIYNKSRKLVKIFVGPVPIDSLKHYIQ